MILEWLLGLFRWLAQPFLVLTMLEQPAVTFDDCHFVAVRPPAVAS